MTTDLKTDVLITGAGPSGLALASQLIRYGVDFIIVDKKEGTTPFSKAIGVQARTLEIYEQIGLADALVAQGNPAERVRLLEDGEARAEVPLRQLGEGKTAYPYLLIVEQGKHEALIYDFIKSRGKDVLWQTELREFSEDQAGVTGTIANASGVEQRIHAQYLVACDGAKSPVRHALGLQFEGSTFERLFYVADVQINWEFPHDMLTACLARDRSTAFFPMPGEDRYRIVGVFPEDTDKVAGEIPYDEIEQQILEDTKLELDIYKVNWFSTYKVHSRRVSSFSKGRCFLAGDAAHIHSPAGAQGMNTGIQDGYNLAWKLATVLRGEADAKLLDTYNEERIVVASRLLETTDRMFDLLVNDSWLISFVRTEIFPYVANFMVSLDSVKELVFPLISQIGISYRGRSLSADDGDRQFEIKAGDRIPYFLIDGNSVYDSLHEPKFHLLQFNPHPDISHEIHSGLASEYPGLIDYQDLALSKRVAEIFGTDKPFAVLLRPDNYIALVTADMSMDPVRTYFTDVIGRSNERRAASSAN